MAAVGMAKDRTTGNFIIPGLDGIRGLAVLTIFVFHAEILPHVPGEFATTTFFFLSGFLITTLFLREWNKTGDIGLKAFYFRRVLRILPPLYLALSLAWLASRFGHVGDDLVSWKVWSNFFQYTNYAVALPRDKTGFLPGMVLLWSLAVDEHYYAFFAPVFKATLKRLPRRVILGAILGLCALALLWRCWLVHAEGFASFRVSMATDTRMDSILWGAFLALWKNPALDVPGAAFLAKPIPVLLGAAAVLLPFLSHSDDFKTTFGYTFEGIGLIPMFSLAIIHGGRGILKVLHTPALMWTSQISYPLYLYSWLSIVCVRQALHAPKPVQVVLAFVVAYALASLTHLYLERPLVALRKRSHKKALQPLPSSSVPEAA